MQEVRSVANPVGVGIIGSGFVSSACESARTGRKVALPFESRASKPIDLWWAEDPR